MDGRLQKPTIFLTYRLTQIPKLSLTMAWMNSQAMLPIFKRLDIHSLVSCTATCKTWYNYLAVDNFFHVEVIIHLVERFNGDVVEWQSFLKSSKRIRQIKVNRERY